MILDFNMSNNSRNITQQLFSWQRVTEPPAYSGIRKSKGQIDKNLSSNISSWLHDVKHANNCVKESSISEKDSIEAEARAVLQEISRKQRIYADDPLCETTENRWRSLSNVPTRTEVKREWDHLLSEDFNVDFKTSCKEKFFLLSGSPNSFGLSRSGVEDVEEIKSKSNTEDLLAMDEKSALENVMRQLKSKDFVKQSDIVKTRGDWRPKVDIKEKMEERRSQLRDARQRREQEAAERRLAAENQRVLAMASKRAETENMRRKAAAEREEQKAMEAAAEELRREELRRRQVHEEALCLLMLEAKEEEMSRQRRIADEQAAAARQRTEQLFEERRRSSALRQLSIRVQTRQRREQTSLLSRCLTAWCEILVERRLQMGHAAALADWNLLRRSFSGWFGVTRRNIAERKAALLAAEAAAERRVLAQADTHRRRFLLKTAFTRWHFIAISQRKEKRLKLEEANMREKMEKFLTFAAASKSAPSSEESTIMNNTKNNHVVQAPKEAWQVTDAHLRLTGAALVTPGRHSNKSAASSSEPHFKCDSTPASTATVIPSLKQPKVVNNFENRNKAQARILSEQAKIIREQSERLEELRFQQEQARLQEAALSEQRHRDLLDKLANLQKHEVVHRDTSELQPTVINENISKCEVVIAPSALPLTSTTPKISDGGFDIVKKPEILRRMDERAFERLRLKEDRLKRRAAVEAAAREQQEAAAHAASLQLQAERRQANLELQEKRRQLEAQRLARLEFEAHQKEQWHRAEQHYRSSLLRRCGMAPLKRLMKLRREFEVEAERHFSHRLLSRMFFNWLSWQREKNRRVNILIDSFRERTLLRQCFSRWQMLRYRLELLEVRADEYSSLRLTARYFVLWHSHTVQSQTRAEVLERQAQQHFQRCLLLRCFRQWCSVPAQIRALREKERRREDLRRRVQSLLPDYQPTATFTSESFSKIHSQDNGSSFA